MFPTHLFSNDELKKLKFLDTPSKIQDYLDSLPFNFENKKETCKSPRRTIREKNAHCIEGGMLAATALWFHGRKPLLLNLKVDERDDDHIVALFCEHGYWGAISKTNHAVLRFRDPVYRSVRELAMSYFPEYFLLANGKKTMRGYSKPINLRRFGTKWLVEENDLWHIAESIYDMPHQSAIPKVNVKFIRDASKSEISSAQTPEWKK